VLHSIYKYGYNDQQVGIIMSNLVPADHRQKGVFVEGPDERLIKLATVMDTLNHQPDRD
jgi:DNA polymerase V